MNACQKGMSLIELMVALVIGLFLVTTFLVVYLAQTQIYRTGVSQGFIQNSENAIAEILLPIVRGAGYGGCAPTLQVLSNLNASTFGPLGTLNTTPSLIMGYAATTSLTQLNAANDSSANHWSPSLDTGLVGNVEAGSDVLVVLGGVSNTSPVGITTITPGSSSFTVQSASSVTVGQYGAISDCLKMSLFQITGVAGTTITHAIGGSGLGNATSALAVNYPVGSQFIPMQQTAFFVGQGTGGQSALMMGIFNGTSWTIQPLVPGVDILKILYGIGSNGIVTRYVPANNVTNWGQVYVVRLGFLIAGQIASGSLSTLNQTQFNMFGGTITIPADNRLRHVYEMTIYLRNTLS